MSSLNGSNNKTIKSTRSANLRGNDTVAATRPHEDAIDATDADSAPLHHDVKVVVPLDPLLLARQNARRVDQRQVFEERCGTQTALETR